MMLVERERDESVVEILCKGECLDGKKKIKQGMLRFVLP